MEEKDDEDNINKVINKLYFKDSGYFKNYSGDLLLASFIIFICISYILVMSSISHIKKVKADWPNKRCNPQYLPFAGWIMPEPGISNFKSTGNNIQYCLQQDLSQIINLLIAPIEFLFFTIVTILDGLITLFGSILTALAELQNLLGELFSFILNFILHIIIPIQVLFLEVRDLLAKANGLVTSFTYAMLTSQSSLISGTNNVISAMIYWLYWFYIVVAFAILIIVGTFYFSGVDFAALAAATAWMPPVSAAFAVLSTASTLAGTIMLFTSFAAIFIGWFILYLLLTSVSKWAEEVFGSDYVAPDLLNPPGWTSSISWLIDASKKKKKKKKKK